MQIWIKNVKSGDAPQVSVAVLPAQFVADPPVGSKELDNLPEWGDSLCGGWSVNPQTKMLQLNGGREMILNSREFSLNQQFSPSQTKVTKATMFQFYVPVCTGYTDDDGKLYSTCNTYRFVKSDLTTTFSCSESPISGVLENMPWGFCEK
jgi:hypothetical protein